MLALHGDSLESQTIRILSLKPYSLAESIRRAASTRTRRYSPAAVYKVLDKLLTSGVIVKTGTRYSLSLSWIFEVFAFTESLGSTYFSEDFLSKLIPAKSKRQTWRFSQLGRCNDFWNQLLLALVKRNPKLPVFAWVPCPWFIMLQQGRESRLQQVFRMSGRTFYTNFCHFGKLDMQVRKVYRHPNQAISFAEGPFSHLSRQYLDVVGDYILSVTLDQTITRRLERLCTAAGRRSSGLRSPNLGLLTEQCSASITLECNAKKARRMRAAFTEFFGA
jgi:hypothetical protein